MDTPDCAPIMSSLHPNEGLAALNLDREHVEESPMPMLLQIPVEIRLRIFQYVFDLDHLQICPHDDRHLVALSRRIVERKGHLGSPFSTIKRDPMSWHYSKVKRHDPLPTLCPSLAESPLVALFTNRQIRNELSEAFVLYLEHCFTYFENYKHVPYEDPHSIQQILTSYNPTIWHTLTKIGFSFNQEPYKLPRVEQAAIQRFKDGFSWLNSHMPNLQTTYLNLFCGHAGRPSNRFLIHLIKSLKQLRGQKIITVHGTNKSKKTIAKQWRQCLGNNEPIIILGGCHCHAFASVIHDYVHNWKSGPPSRADTLSSWFADWTEEKAELAIEGAPMVRVNQSCRGPLIGCLLCRVGTHCIHNRKYDPRRITPTFLPSGQFLLFDADGNRLPAVWMDYKYPLVLPKDDGPSVQLQGPITDEEEKYMKEAGDWQERNWNLPREDRQSWYEEEEYRAYKAKQAGYPN